jgi:hypothetical protein
MTKKVNVKVTVDLLIRMDDDANLDDILHEMDYEFKSTLETGDIEDSTIEHYEITNVR